MLSILIEIYSKWIKLGNPLNVYVFGLNSERIFFKSFLYLIYPEKYATKAEFIKAVQKTNYDLIMFTV